MKPPIDAATSMLSKEETDMYRILEPTLPAEPAVPVSALLALIEAWRNDMHLPRELMAYAACIDGLEALCNAVESTRVE